MKNQSKRNKWNSILLSLVMIVFYCLPNYSFATTLPDNANIAMSITNVNVSGGKLQPGDSFSLDVQVEVSSVPNLNGQRIIFTDASVSGAIDASSKPYLNCLTSDVINGVGIYEFTVGGLSYSGSGNSVSVSIQAEADNADYTASTNSKEVELSVYSQEELSNSLVVEKQDNILVKTGATQSIDVKVTNKGNFTVKSAEVQLSLDKKVEGLTVKSDKKSLTNVKSKEVKNATFSIEVGKDVKAGVYPATVTVLGNSYSVNIQVDSTVVPSALEVSLGTQEKFLPGVEKATTIHVKNVGERDAKNIRVEVVNTENVAIMENSNVKRLSIIKANSSEAISIKVRINSNYKGDSVALPIKLTYLSSTGEEEEDTQYIYLYTNSSTTASEVVISNVISPTNTFGVDQNFNIKFNVSSKQGAENIQVSVEGDEGIVPKSQNLFFVNKLASGESKQFTVSFAATRAAVSSSHPIKITVTYGTGESPTTINQYGSVNISNPKKDQEDEDKDEKQKGKPKVIIGEYEINPTIVQAGEEFVLTMGFLNTNSKHTVHNLKANILPVQQESSNKSEDTGNVFTPVDGSNTIFISDLGTGEMVTKELTMYTIPSAVAKTYQITVQMAYEDEEGNEIEATETLGIPVEQVTKIEVGDVYVDQGMVGTETPFSVTFYNRGRTNISNMMVYIKGDGFDVQENRTFIGNFEIGASEVYEPTIVPNQAGALKGTLVVEYEEPSGKAQVIEQEFDFQVDEMIEDMGMNDMGMDPSLMEGEGEKPNASMTYVGIGVGVLIAIVIVMIVLKKRKEKKEERLLDEED